MERNSGEAVNANDHLDDLLRGFKSRNEFRSDPNYVLEPLDLTTSIPDRFVKILRTTSLDDFDEEFSETVPANTEPETNSGLILLAENYDKKSRAKSSRGRILNAIAVVILVASVITFAALAGYVLAGLATAVIGGVLLVLARTSTKEAAESQNIAQALIKPEDAPEK